MKRTPKTHHSWKWASVSAPWTRPATMLRPAAQPRSFGVSRPFATTARRSDTSSTFVACVASSWLNPALGDERDDGRLRGVRLLRVDRVLREHGRAREVVGGRGAADRPLEAVAAPRVVARVGAVAP